jgi:hypothetical protein
MTEPHTQPAQQEQPPEPDEIVRDAYPIAVPDAPEENRAVPEYLPDKFWNSETGEVRIEDLARSYSALERRLGAVGGDTVPDDPAGYRIEPAMEGLTPDAEVNTRLMEAGFTQAQAQLVYDLAAEKLAPLVQDLAVETVHSNERRRLADHFGGQDRWQTTSSQIEAWGRANLPAPVFDALSTSYDGVLTLHRMMQDGEPQMVSGASPSPSGQSETQLRKMMQDPRYWRDHDPAFAAEVRRGFEDLYPDER